VRLLKILKYFFLQILKIYLVAYLFS
jgi:hypothetical protein